MLAADRIISCGHQKISVVCNGSRPGEIPGQERSSMHGYMLHGCQGGRSLTEMSRASSGTCVCIFSTCTCFLALAKGRINANVDV